MLSYTEKILWSQFSLARQLHNWQSKALLRFSRPRSQSLWYYICFTCMLKPPDHNSGDYCCFIFPASCYLCSTGQEACLSTDVSFQAKPKSRWGQCCDSASFQDHAASPLSLSREVFSEVMRTFTRLLCFFEVLVFPSSSDWSLGGSGILQAGCLMERGEQLVDSWL